MPATPKVTDALCLVGRVEIQRKPNAEKPSDPDRHVRVAGKIKIQLKRIGERANPCGDEGDGLICSHSPKALICPRRDCVGNENFFRQPHRENRYANTNVRGAFTRPASLAKLRLGFLLINDRAGDDLREESREEQKLEVAAGQSLASAAAHEPGNLHEGDEGNPQRQQDFFNEEIGLEDGVEIRDEKIRVFEIAKDENIEAHRENEEPFPTRFAATLECRAQQVVDRRERQKQCQHRGVSPGIKNQRSR